MNANLMADLLQQSLRQGQRPLVTITSNSMAPLLKRGDQVEIEPAVPEQLQKGDILLLAGSDSLIVHRYWSSCNRAGQAQLLTRGDRLPNFDPPWPVTQLIGRVVSRQRRTRWLPLVSGAGLRLNRRLTQLAAAEMDFLQNSNHQDEAMEPLLHPLPCHYHLLRRLFFAAAILIAAWARLIRSEDQ